MGDVNDELVDSTDCPFSIVIDTREQLPYTFSGLRANASQGARNLNIITRFAALPTGDYILFGHPGGAVVERKSKADLYQSISKKRENFEERLERMCCQFYAAAVVVEAELGDVLANPPAFTQYPPKSLYRSILMWMIRWPKVNWLFLPTREVAEATTFRFLEKYWECWNADMFHDATVKRQLKWASDRPELAREQEVVMVTDSNLSGTGMTTESRMAIKPEVAAEVERLEITKREIGEGNAAGMDGKVLVNKHGRKYYVDAIEFE